MGKTRKTRQPNNGFSKIIASFDPQRTGTFGQQADAAPLWEACRATWIRVPETLLLSHVLERRVNLAFYPS